MRILSCSYEAHLMLLPFAIKKSFIIRLNFAHTFIVPVID